MSLINRRTMLQALLCSAALLTAAGALAQRTVFEGRPVSPFDRIEVSGPADLEFHQGLPHSLVIEADARVISQITAWVDHGVLRFDYGRKPFVTDAPVRFLVSAPKLEALQSLGSGDVRVHALHTRSLSVEAAGSGDISLAELSADTLKVRHSGSGNMRAGGRVASLDLHASGSGDHDASTLHSDDAHVFMSGSGDAAVRAARQLVATLNGSGDLHVSGRPQIRQIANGSGELLLAAD